jgi:hypothetical protein
VDVVQRVAERLIQPVIPCVLQAARMHHFVKRRIDAQHVPGCLSARGFVDSHTVWLHYAALEMQLWQQTVYRVAIGSQVGANRQKSGVEKADQKFGLKTQRPTKFVNFAILNLARRQVHVVIRGKVFPVPQRGGSYSPLQLIDGNPPQARVGRQERVPLRHTGDLAT